MNGFGDGDDMEYKEELRGISNGMTKSEQKRNTKNENWALIFFLLQYPKTIFQRHDDEMKINLVHFFSQS